MPQISPMNWLYLLIMFIFIVMLFMIKLFFSTVLNFSASSKFNSVFNKNYSTWTW